MKIKKTSQMNRGVYKYYFDNATVTIRPGEDDITEKDIKLLHSLDDAEVYNNLKNSRMPLSEKEKEEKKEWVKRHPGEQYPRRWNLSIEYAIDDDSEYSNDKSNISLATAIYPEEEASKEELMEEYLWFLTDLQRRVFWYVKVEEYTQTETAEMLGCSVANINKHLKAAGRRIAAYYEGMNKDILLQSP